MHIHGKRQDVIASRPPNSLPLAYFPNPDLTTSISLSVVGESLEVVEAGFLLCDLTGKGFAIVKEMGFQNVVLLIMAHRRWRNGEAMLLESVVPTDKEALKIAQSVMAVFVVKVEGRIVEALTAVALPMYVAICVALLLCHPSQFLLSKA